MPAHLTPLAGRVGKRPASDRVVRRLGRLAGEHLDEVGTSTLKERADRLEADTGECRTLVRGEIRRAIGDGSLVRVKRTGEPSGDLLLSPEARQEAGSDAKKPAAVSRRNEKTLHRAMADHSWKGLVVGLGRQSGDTGVYTTTAEAVYRLGARPLVRDSAPKDPYTCGTMRQTSELRRCKVELEDATEHRTAQRELDDGHPVIVLP